MGKSKIEKLSRLIGNTPLLKITYDFRGSTRSLYAKAEHLNFTGSIKDRMAYHILQTAYEKGELKKDDLIVEATSGNTGISFSSLGRALGHEVQIFMPDWMSSERINLIKSLGAKIELISKEAGGFLGSIKRAEELKAERKDIFLPRQFSNCENAKAHYLSTGPEIWNQLSKMNRVPDAFIAGVGTGGTIMGVSRFLKEKNLKTKFYPLEPSNSPTLTTGYKVGKHRIQGISDEFIPPIMQLSELDKIVSVDDGDAIIMAQKLAQDLGLGVGISSGANFLGALLIQEELGYESIVVTVFPDDNKKYLSTDLLRSEPLKNSFYSSGVKLLGYEAY